MTVLNPKARPQGYCAEVFREQPGSPSLNTASPWTRSKAKSRWWRTGEEQGTPVRIALFAAARIRINDSLDGWGLVERDPTMRAGQ